MKSKYLVWTTMGSSIIDLDDQVYVEVSPSSYLRKKAPEINVGNMILFQNPFAKTDLEDVDPYLVRSPRYSKAKEILHEKNSKEEYIPKLRTLLVRGLSKKGVIQSENLEDVILCEADDFSNTEYDMMTNYVSKVLDGYNIQKNDATIKNWLSGQTLAPRNWNVFKALENEINSDFSFFTPNEDDPKSMNFNYQLYVVIRRGIMKYLNKCRGTTGVYDTNEKKDPKISLSPEYAIVFQHFMNEKDESYSTARVIKIEKIMRKRFLDHIKETNKSLDNGIVKDELENIQRLLKSYTKIYNHLDVLEACMSAGFEEHFYAERTLDKWQGKTHTEAIFDIWSSTLPLLYDSFGEGLDCEMDFMMAKMEESKDHLLPRIAKGICDDIFDGNMDKNLQLDRGSIMSLVETTHRLRKVLPPQVFEYYRKSGFVDDKDLKPIKKALRNLGFTVNTGKIHAEGVFLTNVLDFYASKPKDGIKNLRTMRHYLKRGKYDKELINWAIEDAPKGDTFLRTKEYTLNILEEYRLENFISIMKEEFIWESMK